ncbi:MAG: sulfurtransferase complex subunit TusB [Candidatus Freyarchaeota archaeon]|nr:sulfurtransferase complex subunit TusB [Candidatus Jordarchaeia archaeon]MBS7280334.1 sulfurtransferase complex subunit TusB [Candidatus Jordarchaeia archaeon]
MKTLIFLNRLDFDSLLIVEKLREKGEDVDVILMQDAVYLALENQGRTNLKRAMEKGINFYVLERDVEIRGIKTHLVPKLELIDYERLVDLLFSDNQRLINL